MSVKQKVLLIISSLYIALFLIVFLASKSFIETNVEKVEIKKAEETLANVIDILNKDVSSINSACGDWAYWDETYSFIKNKNYEFVDKYLDINNFSTLKINSIIFLDLDGNIVYDKSFNLLSSEEESTPIELKQSIPRYFKNQTSGIMFINNKPMLISANYITNKERNSDGILIMGSFINNQQVNWISGVVGSDISFNEKIDENPKTIFIPIADLDKNNISTEIGDVNTIYGHIKVNNNDIGNLFINAKIPRTINAEVYKSFNIFMRMFIVIVIFITIITIIAFQKVLLNRINSLNKFVTNIKSFDDLSRRTYISGNDEISILSRAMNEMLNELENSNERILENEERLRLVLQGTNDGFWDLYINSGEIFISSHIAEILGLAKEEMFIKLKKLRSILDSLKLSKLKSEYVRFLRENSNDIFTMEHKIIIDNKTKWVSIKGRIVMRDEYRNPIRMAGTVTDISEKKKSEKAIKYLSKYDVLTGVYNRASFNSELNRLDSEASLPLSIILCDANGLKLSNDAFGHKQGDRLLINIAYILKKASGENGIVARLGGDEFAVILPNTDEKNAKLITDNIVRYCEEAEAEPIKPSIAMGYVTRYLMDEDMNKLIDKAEDRMYRNKLLQDKSARHSIVASLERSLLETDYETRAHTVRLQELAVKLGKSINLSNDKLDELSVLASLHDIGKIAIPKAILTKPGPLNEEEWEIIKKHCEIGYRIAVSSIELMPIANYILTHHEKWDGTGYPKGLKGEEIPLLSRIISIVDAYDVITNSRPYKKGLTHEEAINEIKKCSGTYFDAKLVEQFVELFHKDDQASGDEA